MKNAFEPEDEPVHSIPNPILDGLKDLRAEYTPEKIADLTKELSDRDIDEVKGVIEERLKERKIRLSDLNGFLEGLSEKDFDEITYALLKSLTEEE